ncbi:MAG: helix-turn-helix domain-containing protein [Limnochordia bacterium]
MSLGRVIRRRRLQLGLTQSELGGSELSKSFISQLERDQASPSLQTLSLIASRLQTTASSLLSEAEGAFPDLRQLALDYLQAAHRHAAAGRFEQAARLTKQALSCLQDQTGRSNQAYVPSKFA